MNEIKLEKRTEGERQAYLEGFEAGRRTGICIDQRTGWISCKERLPEKGGRYLCTIEITRDFVAEPFKKSRVLGIVGYSDMGDWVLMVYGAEVIAWRELGEPYKGE